MDGGAVGAQEIESFLEKECAAGKLERLCPGPGGASSCKVCMALTFLTRSPNDGCLSACYHRLHIFSAAASR